MGECVQKDQIFSAGQADEVFAGTAETVPILPDFNKLFVLNIPHPDLAAEKACSD